MKHPDPQAVAKKMVHVCEVMWHFGDDALRKAKEETSTLRGRDYAGSGRSAKGSIDDQVGDVATARADRKDKDLMYDKMAKAIIDLDKQLSEVACLFEKMVTPLDEAEAKRKLRKPGSGDCGACGRWVSGVGDDRIRSGYCAKDYKSWNRKKATGMSRSDFEIAVRKESI